MNLKKRKKSNILWWPQDYLSVVTENLCVLNKSLILANYLLKSISTEDWTKDQGPRGVILPRLLEDNSEWGAWWSNNTVYNFFRFHIFLSHKSEVCLFYILNKTLIRLPHANRLPVTSQFISPKDTQESPCVHTQTLLS